MWVLRMVTIWPDLVSRGAQDQDAKDKQHREPDLAKHGGVALHFIQQAAQHIPLAHFSHQLSCFLIEQNENTKKSFMTRSLIQ